MKRRKQPLTWAVRDFKLVILGGAALQRCENDQPFDGGFSRWGRVLHSSPRLASVGDSLRHYTKSPREKHNLGTAHITPQTILLT